MRRARITTALATLAALSMPAARPDTPPTEYEVKAAFLYQFARFVRWPDSAFQSTHSPWRVCVAGDDPFGDALDRTLEGRRARGRTFQVERLRSVSAVHGCHILFVHDESAQARILAEVGEQPTLSVSDRRGFLEAGGVMEFELDHHRVRFNINAAQARREELKFPSQLLVLAKRVIEK